MFEEISRRSCCTLVNSFWGMEAAKSRDKPVIEGSTSSCDELTWREVEGGIDAFNGRDAV